MQVALLKKASTRSFLGCPLLGQAFHKNRSFLRGERAMKTARLDVFLSLSEPRIDDAPLPGVYSSSAVESLGTMVIVRPDTLNSTWSPARYVASRL